MHIDLNWTKKGDVIHEARWGAYRVTIVHFDLTYNFTVSHTAQTALIASGVRRTLADAKHGAQIAVARHLGEQGDPNK